MSVMMWRVRRLRKARALWNQLESTCRFDRAPSTASRNASTNKRHGLRARGDEKRAGRFHFLRARLRHHVLSYQSPCRVAVVEQRDEQWNMSTGRLEELELLGVRRVDGVVKSLGGSAKDGEMKRKRASCSVADTR